MTGYAEIRFLVPGHGRRPRSKQKRKQIIRIRERDGDRCWICENEIDFSLPGGHDEAVSLDHVVPFARGGMNTIDNLRLAHRVCNERRNARTSDAFREEQQS